MCPMSSTVTMPTSVPAFIAKLWHMVSDKSCDNLISWVDDGTSFVIKDQVRFCAQLLPRYYKHNNMASFIRQLNKYGFHKVSSIESSSLQNEKGHLEFSHEFFVRGCVESLEMIKRKMSSTSREVVDIKGDMEPLLQGLFIQVQDLKEKHQHFESRITTMKSENDALWREHSVLRQKYIKQQKMINKLIQFLVTLVQQTRGVNRARSVPLILKDLQQTHLMAIEAKQKDSPVIFEVNEDVQVNSPPTTVPPTEPERLTSSPTKYLINSPIENVAVDTDISNSVFVQPESPEVATTLEIESSPAVDPLVAWSPSNTGTTTTGDPLSPFCIDVPVSSEPMWAVCPQDVNPAIIARRPPSYTESTAPIKKISEKSSSRPDKKVNQRIALKKDREVSPGYIQTSDPILKFDDLPSTSAIDGARTSNKRKEPDSSLVVSETPKSDLENHLDVVQTDLDSLKDILQGLDTSAFMSMFNNDQDPFLLNMTDGLGKQQQLVSFNPGLIDITDMLDDEDADPLISSSGELPSSSFDSVLNTPQPSTTEPDFNLPKKQKRKY